MKQTTCKLKMSNFKLDDYLKKLAIGIFIFSLNLAFAGIGFSQQANTYYDFSGAAIVIPDNLTETEQAAVDMLVDEVKKRTILELPTDHQWPDPDIPVIVIGTVASFKGDPVFDKYVDGSNYNEPEGFTIKVKNNVRNSPTLFIIGNDSRGMLFGAGYFLRKSSMIPPTSQHDPDRFEEWSAARRIGMIPGKLMVPGDIDIETYPVLPLRGHQLGYRPKVNTYDGWTAEMYEQYIRDLIVFGTNAIELIPPNTDDDSYSPMFTLPPHEMNIRISKILEKYGIDAWYWYPLMYDDYSISENFQRSLDEAEAIFSSLPKIDAVFNPGGDPGIVEPHLLFDYMEAQAQILRKYHPEAEMWLSPQGFSVHQFYNVFLPLLEEEPEWLTGIVQGPWVRKNVDNLRTIIPSKYPIRWYPDITHTRSCQYPVPNWDLAYAQTLDREPINPRPVDQSIIFHSVNPDNLYGFLTYSEGVNDDVNKIVWSGLGWNPDTDLLDILRDYSRFFIGPDYTDDFARGLLDLEQNWNGPLLSNNLVYVNHAKFQTMEKRSLPGVRLNWRFQQALYRSYYDAYTRSRLLYETQLEDAAMNILRKAPEVGSVTAMNLAKEILDKAKLEKVSEDWRQRTFELAEALFHSIRMQLSHDKYYAISVGRGGNLDLIDAPLNNRVWLENHFNRIAELDGEGDRLVEIDKIINWENPGPGGFYTDFGDLSDNPHLVPGESYEEDPESYNSPLIFWRAHEGRRTSWQRNIQTLFGTPLKMHYSNLDKYAQYQLKITYIPTGRRRIKLTAGENIVVHDLLDVQGYKILTFDIPQEATKDGELTLTWNMEIGLGRAGRGNDIAEMWLIKKRD
jgi:hypothetical protein